MGFEKIGIVVLAFGVSACGDFSQPDDTHAFVTLGSEGGKVTLRGLALDVPAGAFGHPVTVEITAAAGANVSEDFTIGPTGLVFPHGAVLQIAYDHAAQGPANELFIADITHLPPPPLPGRSLVGTVVTATVPGAGRYAIIRCPAGVCPH